MIWHLFDLNSRLNFLNKNINQNELKYGYVSNLEYNINNLYTKVSLYKAKILSLIKLNDKYQHGLKLLFDGHFADIIIKILFKKYHSYFQKINLNFVIAEELMKYFENDAEKKSEILQKLKNEKFIVNDNLIEEEKNENIDNAKNSSKIKFIKNILKENIIVPSTILNFLLELFFYTKKRRNSIGHPNLEPEENIKIKEIEKNVDSIDKIIDNVNIDSSTEGNNELEDNLEAIINEKVNIKMKQIKDEIMNNFFELSTKKKLNITEIINFMFKGKINAVWTNQFAFLRTLINDIDNIIQEQCEIEFTSYKNDMRKLNEHKEIIENLSKEKIVETFFIDIDTKEYENLEYLISSEFAKIREESKNCSVIKSLKNIDYCQFIKLIFNKTIESEFSTIYTEHEYMEIIHHISIPFIIQNETDNLEILKSNANNKFVETMVMMNVKNKTAKILELIQDYFNINEISEDYIKEVKKFCSDKDDDDYGEIIDLKIDFDSIIFYLKALIGEENILWLENDKEKGKFSLPTLLYYFQNY